MPEQALVELGAILSDAAALHGACRFDEALEVFRAYLSSNPHDLCGVEHGGGGFGKIFFPALFCSPSIA
ncbi:MAG: hypothetical protein HQL53_12820 [Magnetococcales bacterium]|nr:hypothetical protein [Magnetococcales bacterium]